mgnify:CR=1 FL=1
MPSLKSFLEQIASDTIIIDKKISPIYEASKILNKADLKGTTVIFNNINGIIGKVVGNLVNTRAKLYRALNVQRDDEAYKKLIDAIEKPGHLREKNFSLKEVDVDLMSLPALKFYELDAGRYLTSSVIIACEEFSGEEICNASIHRILVLGKDKAVARIVPRHLFTIVKKYSSKGKETPIAIVIGVHPSILIASATSPPYGVFELRIAGKLYNETLHVSRTPKYNIPIPYETSIVLEGRITNEHVDEGPFVDITGTYDKVRKQPLIKIDAMYISDDIIGHAILPAGNEHKILQGFPREALIWRTVSSVVPKVYGVRLTPGGCGWLHAVIAIEKAHEGDGKNAILAAFTAHPSLKHVIVVDPDICIDDPHSIEWALATRFRADRDLIIINNVRGSTLDPTSDDGLISKLGFDATIPLTRRREDFIRARIP